MLHYFHSLIRERASASLCLYTYLKISLIDKFIVEHNIHTNETKKELLEKMVCSSK